MGIPNEDPLFRQVQSVQFTDNEIRRLMLNASEEAGRIVTSSASDLRKAQVALSNVATQTWKGVGSATGIGIGDAVYGATEFQALFDEDLFRRAGISATYWRQSMIATASQGISSVVSRKQNGIALSDRVWQNTLASRKALNDTINTGLLLGKSPAEIAKSVKGYLNPNVPGGASYAAMRLGRTEVLNAYHTTAINRMKATPWVEYARWHLSGSHPKPDECNEYAAADEVRGMPSGVWPIGKIPAKPHPNCLCYTTPVSPDLDTYAKNFKDGKYDDYIDEQMGCYRVA